MERVARHQDRGDEAGESFLLLEQLLGAYMVGVCVHKLLLRDLVVHTVQNRFYGHCTFRRWSPLLPW